MSTPRAFLFLALSSACSSNSGGAAASDAGASDAPTDAASPVRTFVGEVAGSDAEIGLVIGGSRAFVFFCGGPMTFPGLTRWFHGDATLDKPFALTDRDWMTSGALQADGVSLAGTLRAGDAGAPLTWTAKEVSPATVAGLYVASDANGMASLIVSQPTPADAWDGLGAYLTSLGQIEQVVPLQPSAGAFRARLMGTTTELVMVRAGAP